MRWTGAKCKIFNVGRYRREAYAQIQKGKSGEQWTERNKMGACDANFFDMGNQEAAALREQVAATALQDMLRWLDDDDSDEDEEDDNSNDQSNPDMSRHSAFSVFSALGPGGAKLDYNLHHGKVAIFDATNSTNKRRQWILEQCTSPEFRGDDHQTGVVFVESVCDDVELINENYRYKISISPDFRGMSTEEAMKDLKKRVQKYESQYETITDDSLSYIKVYNLSTKLLVNHIYGRMAKELVPALMAWHIGTRPVYLCRPGQTLSGIFTDGEDYVARNRLNTGDPCFAKMSKRKKRQSLRGDSLGPLGERFRQELFDFCYDDVHSFMLNRASVRDMASTGTSISGLAPAPGVSPFSGDEKHTPSRSEMEHQHPSVPEPFPLQILTSTMPRAVDTVTWPEYNFPINQMSNLNPLDKGDFAGKELDEIKQENPTWFESLERDPFRTR